MLVGRLCAGAFSTQGGGSLFQCNGSQPDVQAAIRAARDGATILLPNGSFVWYSPVWINKSIRLIGQSPGGVIIQNHCNEGALLKVSPSARGPIEIANLRFVEAPSVAYDANRTSHHLGVSSIPRAQPVLLHDCQFETNGHLGGCVNWQLNGGIIWNCTFYTHQQDNGGIQFKNPVIDTWRMPSTMGTADANGTANTYVEDCTFTDIPLQAMDFDDGARVVIRHNVFHNSAITSHGQDTSPFGNRHWEIYNNTFSFTPSGDGTQNAFPQNLMNYFIYLRGGTGVIFSNEIDDIKSQWGGDKAEIEFTVFSIRRGPTQIPCQTRYPAARQIGQTWVGGSGYGFPACPQDGTGYGTDPVYIWGNTGGGNYNRPGVTDYDRDECHHGLSSDQFIRAGRDYVLGQAKPGYAPYPYPHPLRGGKGARKRSKQAGSKPAFAPSSGAAASRKDAEVSPADRGYPRSGRLLPSTPAFRGDIPLRVVSPAEVMAVNNSALTTIS